MSHAKAAADRAEAIDRNRRTQIANQADRISKYVAFLKMKGLLKEFNNWEEQTRSS